LGAEIIEYFTLYLSYIRRMACVFVARREPGMIRAFSLLATMFSGIKFAALAIYFRQLRGSLFPEVFE
jgi:hypothetical protein